ncbi:hypothetical protein HT031_000908 [Scenedesmus sp. PABB004]|nr:hypothetical protein HT031_000908 [Scenedesmus sp. PABB004]
MRALLQRPAAAAPARPRPPPHAGAASLRGAPPPRPRRVACGAVDLAKFASQSYLDKAAARFKLGLEQGLDEDFLVSVELGATSREELSETQLEYVEKIKQKLVQRAAELAAEEAERKQREAAYLEAGKKAYERGQYGESLEFLEQAVEMSGKASVLGGEAMMWLALAYQACGRESDCIATYKWLEDNHPVPKVRKQAADLRYIMEAPKLPLGPDERVTIPLLNSDESWVKKGGRKSYTPRAAPGAGAKAPAKKSYWDSVDWDAPLPRLGPDAWYVRVAWAVLAVGLTVYLNIHAAGGGAAGGGPGA